ncbi:MAG: hypothetical protein AMXMBFR64_44780 [Myxococcales bacterium]
MSMRLLSTALAALLATTLTACPDEAGSAAGAQDTGAADDVQLIEDVGEPDMGAPDVGEPDTGTPDTGPAPDAGTPCKADADCVAILGELAPCTKAACLSETSACAAVAADNGSPCDDGNQCTVGDTCQEGACTAGAAKTCEDDNPCTDDACNPVSGCVSSPNKAACDDDNPCTAGDTCAGGVCAGKPKTCDDGNPCTADGCDAKTGCTYLPKSGLCEDGDVCTASDFCEDGECKAGEPACPTCETDADCAPYEDGNLCDGITRCLGGYCKPDPATIPKCDTSKDTGCDVTQCVPDTGLCKTVTLSEGDPCNDKNGCTEGETCQGGQCKGGKVVCTSGCKPTEEPGCGGCSCEGCVCALDPFCCNVHWDESCVGLCKGDCGMDCGPVITPPDGGCTQSNSPGCGGCACESCVCGMDPYCCNNAWDSLCVDECSQCGTNCGGGGGGANSCAGNCGGSSPSGSCYCDSSCSLWGDCCSDYFSVCGGGGGSSCVGNCGGSAGGCWCDSSCVSFGDCCADACSACGMCPCTPSCAGKQCGDNGCGGSCGTCAKGTACYGNVCEAHCGNTACEPSFGENCATCPGDCGTCPLSSGCVKGSEPTCGGCVCEACACQKDSYCCNTAWDADCVALCQGTCGGCFEHAGCQARPEPGCDGCACEECVCAKDPLCCSVAWDATCVAACQLGCGEDCGLQTCEADLDCFDGDPCTTDSCPVAGGLCTHEAVPGCCAADADCVDDDDCTEDLCVVGQCVNPGACCEQDAECDDDDPCTADTCGFGHLCKHGPAADEGCCPEGPILALGFESLEELEGAVTIVNSSTAGGFQLTTAKAKTGLRSLWFGSTTTGDMNFGPATSSLTTGLLALPPSYTLALTFDLVLDSDNDADLEVRVLVDGKQELAWSSSSLSPSTAWTNQSVSLKKWGGKVVRLQLVAIADNTAWAHDGGGIFVDDVKLLTDCFFPVCGDGECNGDEDCFTCADDCAFPEMCPKSDGCKAWANPTCAGCTCESCVCAQKPECCSVIWDAACATACKSCGGGCGGCAGNCGSQAPDGCWCDSACVGFGDCCNDACDNCGYCMGSTGTGCAGNCDSYSYAGNCYCDSICVSAGDCCSDACSICGYCY